MGTTAKTSTEKYKRVKSILVSQQKPEHSPYAGIEKKYELKIDFIPFNQIDPVTEKEFRKARIRPDEFTAVIFSSKTAIEHYFRMCDEMRIKVNPDMKYFCLTEAIGNYLQKFILYRKRKVFVGTKKIEDLSGYFNKHKNEKFILPCSDAGANDILEYLSTKNIKVTEAIMYRTVSCDLSYLKNIKYDVLVFFSPLCLKSLYDNFPDFKQNDTRIAAFGSHTSKAILEMGLNINIKAPAPDTPSMSMALEKYLTVSNK
ncbi:MAG: uroporphyrinogen-III synthase [Saprospiraceae bacterium]